MGGASYPAGVTSLYGETLEVSAALASLGLPGIQTKQAIIYNPNYDFRLHINPAIRAILFYDNSRTGSAKWINLRTNGRDLTDRTTIGSGTVLDTITTADRLLICFSDIVGGFHVDMTASFNTTANRIMQCTYPVLAAWTALTKTDGTVVSTADSLGKDGAVTFTAPTDWAHNKFNGGSHLYGRDLAIDDVDTGIDIGTDPGTDGINIVMDADPSTAIKAGDYIICDTEVMHVNSSSATGNIVNANRGALGSTAAAHTAAASVFIYRFDCPSPEDGHWLKVNWTGGSLHTDVEIQDIWSLNKNANRGYFHSGVEYPISFDARVAGAIEVILDADKIEAGEKDVMEITWIRTII